MKSSLADALLFTNALGAHLRAALWTIVCTTACLTLAGCAAARPSAKLPRTFVKPAQTRSDALSQAIDRGVAFLEKSQNADGSWGTGTETRGTEIVAMAPGSHATFRLATTALCVMALREAGESKSRRKGVDYLLASPDVRRDDGVLLYNTWAHIYVAEALAKEFSHEHDPRAAAVARRNIQHLSDYSTYIGGWDYYDFELHTQVPGGGPTSFGTAAGLVCLYEARQAGLDVPQRLIALSLHRLEEMRLPNGVFSYGTDYKYLPRLPANMPRGAVGRTQPSNYALWLWNAKHPTPSEVIDSLNLFFEDHVFLDMGRTRPYPHESWYQTSGYYYYFDHYYAARLLEAVAPEHRSAFARELAAAVLLHQDADGSWWDYAMWDFHKPYGTAFAIMTLLRCG